MLYEKLNKSFLRNMRFILIHEDKHEVDYNGETLTSNFFPRSNVKRISFQSVITKSCCVGTGRFSATSKIRYCYT